MYLPHAGIPFFGDDFEFRFPDPRPYILGAFGYSDLRWFRPIKASWCALNQYLLGEDTFVLQGGQIALHGVLTCVLFSFLRTIGLRPWPSLLGGLWFLANPINVSAVLGRGDTIDQVGSGAAGFLSFALAWRFSDELRQASSGTTPPLRLAAGCLTALAIGLLFKESGLAFSVIVPLVLGFAMWRCRRDQVPGATRRLVLFMLACVAITAVYLIYREIARDSEPPITFGMGRYEFRIGGNILVNEALLLGAPFLPFSSADAYAAVVLGTPTVLGAMGLGLLAWLTLIAAGLTIGRQWPAALGLGILAACTGVPVVLMNHVSELYAYNVAPFAAVIVALALSALLEARRSRLVCGITAVFFLGVLVSNVVAVNQKAARLAVRGHHAVVLIPQVVEFARDLPRGGTMLLYDPLEPGSISYSDYLGGPLSAINDGSEGKYVGRWVKHLARRSDINVNFVTELPRVSADAILVLDTTTGGPSIRPLARPSK